MGDRGKNAGHFEQEPGGRSSVVGADEMAAGHGFGVVMASEDDDASGSSGKSGDDVLHGHRPDRRSGGEGILDQFTVAEFDLRFDIGLQLMDGGRARGTGSEGDGFARKFEGR